MSQLEAREIVRVGIERPALAYERCHICGEKQTEKFIMVRPITGDDNNVSLCAKCARRLVWILPRVLNEFAS
jgi:hypothetical protein